MKNLEGCDLGLNEVLFQPSPGGIQEIHEHFRIVDDPAEIRTEHVQFLKTESERRVGD
jgi:hypothetical protein